MKTFSLSKEQAIADRKWLLVDASNQTLGRLASQIAALIRGKHKPTFTKHIDSGDFVVVKNAAKIKLTGNKWATKRYISHSGYMGGIKEVTAENLHNKHPENLIIEAVKGMLPKGALGHQMIGKLKVYADDQNPHNAQMAENLTLKY